MDVALVTVGDELLAGDTENTNATWLARRLSARGAAVRRVLTIPDDRTVIARWVREWAAEFDAVLVTGGLGGTHDDVTKPAVADAFDRDLVVDGGIREDVRETARAYARQNPEMASEYDVDLDYDAQASIPAEARPLVTEESLGPGFVIENVYVFPGIPEELHVMFEEVAEEFGGDVVSETLYTPAPEGALGDRLATVRDRFDVVVGSYPGRGDTPGRVKVTGTDADAVGAATDWLRERITLTDPPE